MRAFDAYKILDEQEAGSLIDLIAPCMDDYLYIIDLKNDTLRISQSAVERFMLPDKFMNDATKHLRTLVYEKDRKLLENHKRKIYDGKEKRYNVLCRLMNSKNLPVWINCRGEVINDEAGKPRYIIGCMNETGTRQRADNISGLLGEKEMASYLYSQPKEKLSGYFIQIGINDFGMINNVHGQIYGNYILKRVAECIAECLSSGQKIYHLVTDKYMLVDMLSKSHDEVVQLFKRIGEKIDEFIVDENYKSIFSVSAGVTDISTLAEGAIECRKKSDFSLKCAKKRGGGSLYFFEEEDYKASLRKNTILSALRSATVNEAALHAVRSGRTVVNESDIEESIEVVIAGYQKKNAVLSDQEKKVVAYHEIGHALVAALQSHSAPVQKITIIPRTSGALGYTMQVEQGDKYLMTKKELENKIATFTGGRAAEEIVFGEITTGASNDIEQATKIARAMITRYGMTDEFDMVAMENVTNQYLGGDTSLSCSADTQKEIDEKVVQLVKAEHEKARKILAENREKLDELAMYLYEKETITGDEFMDILDRK